MKRTPLTRSTPLRRHTRIRRVAANPKRRSLEEHTPEAVAYKRFVKSLICAGCGRADGVDAHHSGEHGLGVKAHWNTLIPLDRVCHTALHDARPPFQDQERRRHWEEKTRKDCAELHDLYNAHRYADGAIDLTTESALRFSCNLAWLKSKREAGK